MEYITGRLIKETVKFLEICQLMVLKGRMDVECYYSLTSRKFSFIDNVLCMEGNSIFIDKNLRSSLNKLYANDSYICGLNKEAVGN